MLFVTLRIEFKTILLFLYLYNALWETYVHDWNPHCAYQHFLCRIAAPYFDFCCYFKSVKNLGLPVCLLSVSRRIQFKAHVELVNVITMKRTTRLLSDRKKEGCLTVPLSWCNALMLFQLGALNLDDICLLLNVNFGLVRIFERCFIALYVHLCPP
jgi:hypothetical protein